MKRQLGPLSPNAVRASSGHHLYDVPRGTSNTCGKLGAFLAHRAATFLIICAPALAFGQCFVHPDTGVLHCLEPTSCPAPTVWNAGTQACLVPRAPAAASCVGVDSGAYTPAITGAQHAFSVMAQRALWTRIGPVVTVAGTIDVQPTGVGPVLFFIPPPIATVFASEYDAAGVSAARSEGAAGLNAVQGGGLVRFVFFGWEQHLREAVQYSYAYRINECP